MTIRKVEWDALFAQAATPIFSQVCRQYPDLFDYSGTFDGITRDPYVDAQVIPHVYLAPTVIVTEGGRQTHLRLEASPASKIRTPADVAAIVQRRRLAIEQ